ncbi:MAG: Tex-like protein [Firmicutes bacterium]|nr:Tex-like protein [Bacillota bacterium]
MPSHRILAINRGERKNMLKVELMVGHENMIALISKQIIQHSSIFEDYLSQAITDSYKRLLFPALDREIRNQLTENAESQAIRVFGLNLRQLLLQPPLSGHTIMGLDPGYRTGCKLAIISPTGLVLETDALYITASQNQRQTAMTKALAMVEKHGVTLISIGNGTASYETEEFAAELISNSNRQISYIITNEAGASVYSASKLAKQELPDLDVSIRGAVSIARRVGDPLAELVKIDPKSIGVGQYQHDVNQKDLSKTLSNIVESCVNHVGVELNTASSELLTYVAGINSTVAKNIISYRDTSGPFTARNQLLDVPRLGKATFTQCAGFLRLQLHHAIQAVDSKSLATDLDAGEPTVRDILAALAKPGRDPREDLPQPLTRKNIVKLSDIVPGTLVKGTVHNVTDFGVFEARGRIALSLKKAKKHQ